MHGGAFQHVMAYKLLETDCPGNGIYRWVMDRAGVGGAFQEYGVREEILNKGGDGSREETASD